MKHFLFTTLFAMCLFLADAGVINCNWPYMDPVNNCILFHGDPDSNGWDDIQFNVYLSSLFSYNDNPNIFNNGANALNAANKLGILFTTTSTANIYNPQYKRFIPLYAFSESSDGTQFNYVKNISFSYTFIQDVNDNFQYSVSIVYRNSSGLQTAYTPYTGNLFLEQQNSMTDSGATVEMAVKDICAQQLVISPKRLGSSADLVNKVFPTSFVQNFTVQYQIEQEQEVSVDLFDANGAMKYSQTEYKNEGFYEKNISEINLPKGIYFCRLKIGNNLETFKLIKT